MSSITEDQLDDALKAEEARKTLLQAYTNTFKGSPNAQLVLKDLRNQFFERTLVVPENQFQTVVNAAKHDVITYILAMIEDGERYAGAGTTADGRTEETAAASHDIFTGNDS